MAERAPVTERARKLMSSEMADSKVRRALKHNVPQNIDHVYQPGDKVLVWREKLVENRIGEWTGPFIVKTVDMKSKIVTVQEDSKSPFQRFNFTQVKPFRTPEAIAVDYLQTLHDAFKPYASPAEALDIRLTEVVRADYERASSPKMQKAILAEVRDLLRRGTFKVVLKEELPDGANALTARFVLAIKSTVDGKVKYKARYVMGGHRDRLKNFLVHDAQTVSPSSTRLFLCLSAMFDFKIWSFDVKLAYLQSEGTMPRDVYIKNPAPEFELAPHECFQLLKPLYGLGDAGDLWHSRLQNHLL